MAKKNSIGNRYGDIREIGLCTKDFYDNEWYTTQDCSKSLYDKYGGRA